MNAFWKAFLVAVLIGSALVGGSAADTPRTSGNAVFDRTVEIANEEFYRPKDLDAFNETVEEIVAAAPDLADADPKAVDAAIDTLLASLPASRCARIPPLAKPVKMSHEC